MLKFKKTIAFLLLAGMFAGMIAGCGKTAEENQPAGSGAGAPGKTETKSSKAAPAVASQPVVSKIEIPAPQAISDPDVFVAFKLRDPNQFVDRLAPWTSIFDASLDAAGLRKNATEEGLVFSEFRPGDDVAAFVIPSGADPNAMPEGVALLPVPTTSQTVKGISEKNPGNQAMQLGQYTALIIGNPTPDAQQAAKAKEKTLVDLEKATAQTDLQLTINTAGLMAKYGEMLKSKVTALQSVLAMGMASQGSPEKAAATQKIISAEIQALLDALDQLNFVNLGVDLGADRLDASLIAKAKAGSGMEKALQTGPVNEPELTQFLDKDSIVRLQETFTDIKGLVDIYVKYMGSALSADPAAVEKIKAQMADISKAGKTTLGAGFGFSADGKIRYEIVSKSEKNDAYIDYMRKQTPAMLNTGTVHDMYKNMGVDVTVQEDPAPRKVDGNDVYHLNIKIQFTAASSPDEKAKIEKMFNGLAMEIGKNGDYVLMAIGEPFETLAARVKAPGEPVMAKKAYAGGGVFYADLNVNALLNMIKTNMPAEEVAQMPKFPTDMPPVLLAGYHADGTAFYRLGLPKGLISGMADAAKKSREQAAPPSSSTQGNAPGMPPGMSMPPATATPGQ